MSVSYVSAPLAAVVALAVVSVSGPAWAQRAWLEPGESLPLPKSFVNDRPSRLVIEDYTGAEAGQVVLPPGADHADLSDLGLAPGYYEVVDAESEARAGFLLREPFEGALDAFFAIDAALSWLADPEAREPLLDLVSRMGVRRVRERVWWPVIEQERGEWDWDAVHDYDSLRDEYARRGIGLLEVFHATPDWARQASADPFPADLVATQDSWRAISSRWDHAWESLEAWNEADWKPFGNNMPADRYVPLVKTLARVLDPAGANLLGGGVFTHICPPEYHRQTAENGMLEHSDYVSFHTYQAPSEIEGMVAMYRDWMGRFGRGTMPLRITEAGASWPKGESDRPPRTRQMALALDMAAKAIEARACGVAGFYAFCLPAYTEGEVRYGLVDEAGYALRTAAAYGVCGAMLNQTEYAGSIDVSGGPAARGRVFARDGEAVVALWSAEPDTGAIVELLFPVTEVFGIDGRPLELAPGRGVPLPDGVTYCHARLADVTPFLMAEDPVRDLYAQSRAEPAPRAKAPDIVLRPGFSADNVHCTPQGYVVPAAMADGFDLTVRVTNLSESPRKVALVVKSDAPLHDTFGEPTSLSVDGRESRGHTWRLDMSGPEWAAGAMRRVEIAATGPDGAVLDRLVSYLRREHTLDDLEAAYPEAQRVELPEAVEPNIAQGGRMDVETRDGVWRLEAQFDRSGRWVYPLVSLPEDLSFAGLRGVIVRARLAAPGEARIILWEGDREYGFFNASGFDALGGAWNSAVLLFEELAPLPTHPKPGATLELDAVTAFSLGFNSNEDVNALEISDFLVIPR